MNTLFDLRRVQDVKTIDAVQNLFDVPLNKISFQDHPINACIGCWSCWLKTPGKCIFNDQMAAHYHDYINSDTVVLLLDTAQGFISHQGKAFLDRTIPHYHPYIEIINQECHHVARYDRYPDMVFYYNTDDLTDQEDQIIEDYLYRTAFHFKAKAYRIKNDGGYQLIQLASRNAKHKQMSFAAAGPMEKLIIYNGSPRRSGSNSSLILENVKETLADKIEIRDLKEKDKWNTWAVSFHDDIDVMFFMPLYVHAMPSHVMAFIELLQASRGNISFFVQSGFPESSQSHYLEAYFEQLAIRLGRIYLGTAINGGVEGLQSRSVAAQEKVIGAITHAIITLVNEGHFSTAEINRLAIPVQLGSLASVLIKRFGGKYINTFWDQQLKTNIAFEKRFDRPYL